jgi:hypothetical protein
MSFAAGETVTAAKLNRLQPKTYEEPATGSVAAATTADIPGCSITLTTETDGAVFIATGNVDFNPTGVPGGDSQIRLDVDGVDQAGLIIYRSGTATDRLPGSHTWRGTLTTAGSHTLKLEATTAANVVVEGVHTNLVVTILEQV